MKYIRAFFKSAAITAVILCLCVFGVVCSMKIDEAEGYSVSSYTQNTVSDGVLSFGVFGKRVDLDVYLIEKHFREFAEWTLFWI